MRINILSNIIGIVLEQLGRVLLRKFTRNLIRMVVERTVDFKILLVYCSYIYIYFLQIFFIVKKKGVMKFLDMIKYIRI